jgi:formylglycine-generating enzyme required for sulfatase activity
MTPREASNRLSAFRRDHGRETFSLACHASLPVVLNAEVVHLLRINYFLDPPHALPYTAEATLLLSSLCTEIDDGLYSISADIRDLLLKSLIEDHGGGRVRDVARLLWEYSQRGAPWAQRPGLTEAQQLTALNFIDPRRAQDWLARAKRGEGSVPVDDDRWFVVLERDLIDRAAAVAEPEVDAGYELPALKVLRDALMTVVPDSDEARELAETLDLPLAAVPERVSASRLWRSILDSAWKSNRTTKLLEAVTARRPKSAEWTAAVRDYWFRLSPALPVDGAAFSAPPPEWAVLEQHRPELEHAIRALVLIFRTLSPTEQRLHGMGVLVGDYAILTHRSMVDQAMKDGKFQYSLFAELSGDHPRLHYDKSAAPSSRRLNIVRADVDESTGLAVLRTDPAGDRSLFPRPLQVMTTAPSVLEGRKVCVAGYPGNDSHRNDPAVLSRILGNDYDVLRLQPGEIIGEDRGKGTILHNCFTAGGNGGSPLIDVETGQVLGLHFGAQYLPGPAGFKKGSAIATCRMAGHRLLVEAGVFETPSPEDGQPAAEALFVNREAEQSAFLDLLGRKRGQILLVEGPRGIGKTALLRRFARLAERQGIRAELVNVTEARWKRDEWANALKKHFESGSPSVLLLDDLDSLGVDAALSMAVPAVNRSKSPSILVLVGPSVADLESQAAWSMNVLLLGPLDQAALHDWVVRVPHLTGHATEVMSELMEMSKGVPARVASLLATLRDRTAPFPPAPPSIDVNRVRTVEIVRPAKGIVFRDDAAETHGPFVVTRGTHAVTVPDRYGIGVYPVTNSLFLEFLRDGGYQHDEFWQSVHPPMRARFTCQNGASGPASWRSAVPDAERAEHPVSGVCYHEAVAFITWLTRAVRAPEGMQWCLPSENMWELAARGPSGFFYPWGPSFTQGRCNSKEAGLDTTSPVTRFHRGGSPFGVHDMAGNVWEFVRAVDDDPRSCVLRGGSFKNTKDEIKSSLRLIRVPRDHRPPDFGFRVALQPEESRPGNRASEEAEKAMPERKRGTRKSGGLRRKVTSRKQAIAIGRPEARAAGGKVPRAKKVFSKKSSGGSKKSSSKKSSSRKSASRKSSSKKK